MAEEDPWAFDESSDAPAADAAPAGDAAAPAADGEGAPKSGDAPAEEEGADTRPTAEDDSYRRPVTLYKHWVRPKFLQYKYMYNYRTNYYDDVIDYLDKRQHGVDRDIPRAQTWAERVMRTNASSRNLESYKAQHKEDKHLIQVLAASIKTHNYHTRAYINRKYSSVL